MARTIIHIRADEEGQDVLEYALIATFVSVICFAAVKGFGLSVSGLWDGVQTKMAHAVSFF